MDITRKSVLTGKIHTQDIDVTEAMLKDWKMGRLIQDAMPHLNADEREFIMTGTTTEEWTNFWGTNKDEEA